MKNYSKIYEHLGDELSKDIFGYRVMYSETGDPHWIYKILMLFPEGKEFLGRVTRKGTRKVIFGAGDFGKDLIRDYPTIWDCFVDNYKYGTECGGIPVISFSDYLKSYRDADVVVASGLWHKDIVAQLREAGIEDNKIINLSDYYTLLENKQYFDLPELHCNEHEIFVDCGCLDGQTSKRFIKWCNNQYMHIYAFEPETDNIMQCQKVLAHDKADVYGLGVWKEKDELHFAGSLGDSSHISEDGDVVIPVDSLDNILGKEKVSFIKMDIEGSELEALQGAKKLIQENHPKLAICIYHQPTDIYKIPQLLLEYNSKYTFYLRHYGLMQQETVLYAID